MIKWADYLISAVAYDYNHNITLLKQHKDTGEKIDEGEVVDKVTVASNINKGISYKTIFSSLSTWKLGDRIRTARVDSDFCLRIDDNKVQPDNLGPLPELESPKEIGFTQKTSKQKSPSVGKITSEAKAILKNMGANQISSIKPSQINSETIIPYETKIQKTQKTKNELLSDYEKDYLKRLENQESKSVDEQQIVIHDSPHGTLPKGFEAKSEINEKKITKTKKPSKKHSKELDDKHQKISSETLSYKIQAYCVKCKTKRDIDNPTQSVLKNGRSAIRGTCSSCGTKVFRLGKL